MDESLFNILLQIQASTQKVLRLTFFLQIDRVIQDTNRPLQLTIEHNPRPPEDPPRSDDPQDTISCPDPCGSDKLSPMHKLPSLEEERPEEERDESIRINRSPPQHQGAMGMRSRHIL